MNGRLDAYVRWLFCVVCVFSVCAYLVGFAGPVPVASGQSADLFAGRQCGPFESDYNGPCSDAVDEVSGTVLWVDEGGLGYEYVWYVYLAAPVELESILLRQPSADASLRRVRVLYNDSGNPASGWVEVGEYSFTGSGAKTISLPAGIGSHSLWGLQPLEVTNDYWEVASIEGYGRVVTATPTASSTATSTATAIVTVTATATESATATATATSSPVISSTATATGTAISSATATGSATSSATAAAATATAGAPTATVVPTEVPPPADPVKRVPECQRKRPCYVVASYSLGFDELGGVPVAVHLPVMKHEAVGSMLGGLVLLAMVAPHFYTAERVGLGLAFVASSLLVASTGQWLWSGGFVVFAAGSVVVRLQQVMVGIGGPSAEG